MLSVVLSLRCLSRVLVYFVSSVFSTTRISTRSRSYQKFELRSKDLVDPPPKIGTLEYLSRSYSRLSFPSSQDFESSLM
jgi:hypothetical protein